MIHCGKAEREQPEEQDQVKWPHSFLCALRETRGGRGGKRRANVLLRETFILFVFYGLKCFAYYSRTLHTWLILLNFFSTIALIAESR